MSERIRQALAMGDLEQAAAWEVEACKRDGYDVTAQLIAELRHQLECEHAVALELIAERDRAVAEVESLRCALDAELERLQQLSLEAS